VSSLLARAFRFCRKEPLVHFAAAGAILFFLHAWRAPDERSGEIVAIEPYAIAALERERSELLGRPLSEEERKALLEELADQEILLREAYQRELDRGDGTIRHRLIDKMRFLLSEEVPPPSVEELEAFYRENLERYRMPETLSFDHVFFAPEEGVDTRETARSLELLRAGADFRRLGERFWLGASLAGYGERELAQILGWDFAREVFLLETGAWAGPIASARGVHLVRVTEKEPPRIPSFREVQHAVREDWYLSRQKEGYERKMHELRKRYRIEIPPDARLAGREDTD
jgi:hypothetical protein